MSPVTIPLPYCTIHYCTVLYCIILYYTLPYCTIHDHTLPCCTIHYHTIPYKGIGFGRRNLFLWNASNWVHYNLLPIAVTVCVPVCVPAIQSFNFEATESRGVSKKKTKIKLCTHSVWFLNLDKNYSECNIQK